MQAKTLSPDTEAEADFAGHAVGPEVVQSLFRKDRTLPPQTLLEPSSVRLGTKPVAVDRYTSQEFYNLELQKLWPRVWQFACWEGDIPSAGDIYVYRNVGQSVLVVRQKDGSVRAFINSCLHRGREICDENSRRSQLRCPYHGFTWRLNGELANIPSRSDFPQIKPEEFRLPEVRVEEWNGFIFINFDADAPKLSDYLGGMVGQWKEWDFSKKFKAVHVEKIVNCNWKAAIDAFIEAYHVTATHPEVTSFVGDANSQYDVFEGEPHFSRFHFILGSPSPHLTAVPQQQEMVERFLQVFLPEARGTAEGTLQPGETARQAFARLSRKIYKERLGVDVERVPESELIDGTEYFVFPNFMPWPSLANPLVYRFRPLDDPDWCLWETMIFLPFEGERPPLPEVIRLGKEGRMDSVAALGFLGPVLQQDTNNFAAIQRGMKASKTGKLTLSEYQEMRIRHYHNTLDKYIYGE